MKKIFLVLMLISSFCFAHKADKTTKTDADTIRIHPIGDSITRGAEGDCYRAYLKTKLKTEANININYVGLCPHGPNYLASWSEYPDMFALLDGDIEHGGWGALKINEITDMTSNTRGYPKVTIEQELDSCEADIILLMAGTNDIISKYLLDEAPNRLATLVTRILNHTAAKLIVTTVPPTPLPTPTKRIDTLNAHFKIIMDTMLTRWSNLTFIDINSALSDSDYTDFLSDAYHPNSSGFQKIANEWYKAIVSLVSTGVKEGSNNKIIDKRFTLLQNYPNPFNPITKIHFGIEERQFTSLKVFNTLGKEVATLVGEEKAPGEYEVEFNPVNQPSGIYICQLKAGSNIQSKKMLFLK